MSNNRDYPLDITEAEQDAGFQLIEVQNPDGLPSDYERFFPVVAFRLSDSELIFKVRSAFDGSIFYKHRAYGIRKQFKEENPDWRPVGEKIYRDPSSAVQECAVISDIPAVPMVLCAFPTK